MFLFVIGVYTLPGSNKVICRILLPTLSSWLRSAVRHDIVRKIKLFLGKYA
jgi:hypothetical protein